MSAEPDQEPATTSAGLRIVRPERLTLDQLKARYPGAREVRFDGAALVVRWVDRIDHDDKPH